MPLFHSSPLPLLQSSGAPAGDVLLSTHGYDDMDPAVAYNGPAGEFLAVWRNGSTIVGQRYDAEGVPLGELFPLSDTACTERNPAVAYSLAGDRYLVVWEDNRNGDYDIYAQLVDANGALLGTNFYIYAGDGNQEYPDVDSDGEDFLVVWHGQIVDDSVDVAGRTVSSGSGLGVVLYIATSGGDSRRYAAVAYNPSATPGEYLVVFEYGDPAEAIHARRVRPDSTLPGSEYLVSAQPTAYTPDLAAGPWGATGGYVVVWDDSRGSDRDVYGRVVLAGSDNAFDGDDFVVSSGPSLQHRAAVARIPTTGQYLVTWEDDREDVVSGWDVYAQRLTDDANLIGANMAVSTAPDDQMTVAVAAGGGPDQFFLAWVDWRTGRCDIYGQRIAGGGSLLSYEFAVSAEPAAQQKPAVAYDHEHEQYLAVWEDDRDGVWAIYGQRLSKDGMPKEVPWAIEDDGHNNTQPVAIYSGSARLFVVVWVDEDLDKLEGRQVPVSGDATTLFSVLDSDGAENPSLVYADGMERCLVAWDGGGDTYVRILGPDGFPWAGASTVLAAGTGGLSRPAIAVDTDLDQFLVAYQDEGQMYGRLVAWDGIPIGFAFLIAGDASGDRHRPSVAYAPATSVRARDGRYLVVYIYSGDQDYDIYGRLLAPDGSPISSELVLRTEPEEVYSDAPQAAYTAGADQYYVLWTEATSDPADFDLLGQWLTIDGSPAMPVLPFFRYAGSQYDPRLIVGGDALHVQGLVVWTDTRRGGIGDVYARLGVVDTSEPVALFTRDPTVGRVGDVFTLDASPSVDNLTPRGALVVRWDWTSDGSWDTVWDVDKAATVTPAVAGVYTVTLQVRDLMWLTDEVSLAIRVLPESTNTPPHADVAVAPFLGPAGTSFEFDGSGSTDAETPAANLQVRWDWENDGLWDTGWSTTQVAAHTFTDAGFHLARMEVRDGGLLTDAAIQGLLVLPGAPVALEVDPATPKVVPGTRLQFAATAWDGYDNEMGNPPVTWSVTDARAGTIGATGLFTATLYGGLYEDVVVATWEGLSDSASVYIVYAYARYLPVVVKGY